MGDDNTDFDRLLAGGIGADDPKLSQVAAFLDRVQTTQELPGVAELEAAHIARVRASLPVLGTPRTQHRERPASRTRRLLVGLAVGLVASLSTGAGVAAAFGVNPIEAITKLPGFPAQLRPGGVDPKNPNGAGDPTSIPQATGVPSAGHPGNGNGQTAQPTQAGGPKPSASNNGRGQDKTHPTPKATKASDKAKSDDGSPRATDKPSATPTKKDKSDKDKD
ncbi:MAG: hypothetical protein L6256_13385 [Propionicimonas sp.]|uniref:hypothetical protein n=1 Tax=Propionicimonas sp. TaxID=1955623 RepID=UPI001D26DB6A|nr:hypothetical protein [Propionicimonas sp.]MBU4188173.1 hypothetical protein [Actinomycetota bacterium]MBU4206595.1 hypothetical protein [Actinomycetota bacterium]MBU4250328.1 hypothetical protein [Actinomycetota bacterium]MBU4365138.1 hypothetical protein [Actinomycetota bacterium]MBU4408772.1 hypothetical protein [Actinomycetota bacterium]